MRSPFQSPFFQYRNTDKSPSPTATTPTSARSKSKHSFSPHKYLNNTSTTSFATLSSGSSKSDKSRSKMGQHNGKFDFDHAHPHPSPPSAFSSPGPDPFRYSPPHPHIRPAPPPPPPSASTIPPEFYHAPHSAPAVPTAATAASKPKGLIRTLSAKRRGEQPVSTPAQRFDDLPPLGSLKALKTLGQVDVRVRMKNFEALVARAEAEAQAGNSSFESETSTLHRGKRLSVGRGLGLDEETPSPVALSATPAYLRPTPHRRSSTSSIHSSRVSIKSARRAEREWRAKVAALSSGLTPLSSSSTSPKRPPRSNGPVPPRRTPAALSAAQTSRSTTPLTEEGTVLITPPHVTPASLGTPLSNKSFETLGHYPNSSPSPVGGSSPSPTPTGDWEARSRKPSVPSSAVSSVYEPRPASYPSTLLLAPSPLRVNVSTAPAPLQAEATTPTQDAPTPISASSCYSASEASPTTPHGRDLPSFESFQTAPRMVSAPALASPIDAFVTKEGHHDSEHEDENKARREESRECESDGEIERCVKGTSYPSSPPRDERKHHSLPSPPRTRTPTNTRPLIHIDPSYQPVLPPLTSLAPLSAPCTPVHPTPLRSKEQASPAPYSPTTAFILSAPSQSLDQLAWSTNYETFASSPEKRPGGGSGMEKAKDEEPHTPQRPKHPFTIGAKPSPANTSSAAAAGPSQILPRHANHTPKDAFIPRQLPSGFSHKTKGPSHVLRPRGPNTLTNAPGLSAAKLAVVGTSDRPTEPGLKRLRGKVDLTPGMEEGVRPPKSGLPIADLERWLASTAISS